MLFLLIFITITIFSIIIIVCPEGYERNIFVGSDYSPCHKEYYIKEDTTYYCDAINVIIKPVDLYCNDNNNKQMAFDINNYKELQIGY